jgi:hypothetical protein
LSKERVKVEYFAISRYVTGAIRISLVLQRKKKKKNLIACRGLGRAVGPLLAALALPLRCAASVGYSVIA